MAVKLLFMDVEGTLFESKTVNRPEHHSHSLWSRIYVSPGQDALDEDNKLIELFDSGKISYIEWCELSMKILQRHGLTKQLFFELVDAMPYKPHVKETVKELHRRGIRLATISGGFLEQAEKAQRELQVQHSLAAMQVFWNEEGTIEHWNILPSDYEAKADFVELLRKECKLTREECAFVGNGRNDIEIAKHVGMSFAYQAHPDLKAVATHTIEDFRDILKYV